MGNRPPKPAETNLREIERRSSPAAQTAARARADGATTRARHQATSQVPLNSLEHAPNHQEDRHLAALTRCAPHVPTDAQPSPQAKPYLRSTLSSPPLLSVCLSQPCCPHVRAHGVVSGSSLPSDTMRCHVRAEHHAETRCRYAMLPARLSRHPCPIGHDTTPSLVGASHLSGLVCVRRMSICTDARW